MDIQQLRLCAPRVFAIIVKEEDIRSKALYHSLKRAMQGVSQGPSAKERFITEIVLMIEKHQW